ncbi:MAG: carbohydrate ABC transporter permease [Clostridiales bacterium]|nr:carbohydrate ABC transporter permease [Clostridiales bacterium]
MLHISQKQAFANRRIHRSPGDVCFDLINVLLLTVFTLICVFPFYYLFINTISDNALSARGLITLLPKGVHFENYIQIFKISGILTAAIVSLARTVIGTTLSVFASAFLGYLLTKRNMIGHKLVYRFIVVTMYFNAGVIPWYINMMNLHLLNNFLVYILPTIVAPYSIILVKTYVESIPSALEDAAQMDGAGYMARFAWVILPVCLPILATITIFSAVGQWNSFQDTLFLISDNRLYTLQFLLYRYMNEAEALATIIKTAESSELLANMTITQTPTSIKMTVSMIVVLPILLVYPYFQKYFVKGIMIGAVKG